MQTLRKMKMISGFFSTVEQDKQTKDWLLKLILCVWFYLVNYAYWVKTDASQAWAATSEVYVLTEQFNRTIIKSVQFLSHELCKSLFTKKKKKHCNDCWAAWANGKSSKVNLNQYGVYVRNREINGVYVVTNLQKYFKWCN